MDAAISAVLTVVGLVMLCLGGNWLVGGGAAIARRFRISNLVIGMTIVAYGTSTPELAASIAAAGEHSAIILGNIVGSNIANVGMVIGVASMLVPLAVCRSVMRREVPIMLGVSLALVLMSVDGEISTYDGAILLAGLGVFGYYTYRSAVRHRDESVGEPGAASGIRARSIVMIIAGVALLYAGAVMTVDNAVVLAKEFGLSEKVIGLTVIAVGTSLPELITSVIAIRRGHADIGIGNIIGSNIYNILMIMGVGAALGGVAVLPDVYLDYAVMMLFSLSLLLVVWTRVIGRVMGAALAACYAAYLVFAFF